MSQNTSSSTMPRITSSVMRAGHIGADLRKSEVRSFRRRHVYTDRYTEPGRSSATEFAYLRARFGAVPGARRPDAGATSARAAAGKAASAPRRSDGTRGSSTAADPAPQAFNDGDGIPGPLL